MNNEQRLELLRRHKAEKEEAACMLADLQAELIELKQAIVDAEGTNSVASLQYDVTLRGCIGKGLADRDGNPIKHETVLVGPAVGNATVR